MKRSSCLDAVVCIPTFQRPDHLRKTLESLVAQRGHVGFAVVVVDNEAARSEGKQVADTFFASGALTGICVVEPQQGNCHAINRAFGTARRSFPDVEFLLMIDDDEVASDTWLFEMVGCARASGADLVGGPVERSFEVEPSRPVRAHACFNSAIVAPGFVPTLHGSGNVLIRRRVFEAADEPSFDLRFNFLGGADMDFFLRCRCAGFKSYWNDRAVVTETVPKRRMQTTWILKRCIDNGVVNFTLDRKRHPTVLGLMWLFVKNIISMPLSVCRAIRLFSKTLHWLPASDPICRSIGRNLAIFGFKVAPYKAQSVFGATKRSPADSPIEGLVCSPSGYLRDVTPCVATESIKSRLDSVWPRQ